MTNFKILMPHGDSRQGYMDHPNWSGPGIEDFRQSWLQVRNFSGPSRTRLVRFQIFIQLFPSWSGPGRSDLVRGSLIPGTNVNVGKCAQGICLPPTRFCWIDIVARGLNGIHSVTFSLFSHFSSLQITKKREKNFLSEKKMKNRTFGDQPKIKGSPKRQSLTHAFFSWDV